MRRFKRVTEVGVENRFNSPASLLDPKLPMEPAAGESQSTGTGSSSPMRWGWPDLHSWRNTWKEGVQDRITARGSMAIFRSCKTEIGLFSVFKTQIWFCSKKHNLVC